MLWLVFNVPHAVSLYVMCACRNQAEITRLLLSKGASVNLLNNSMCTALHIAVNKGFTDVVRVLTEHSADVNLQVKHTTHTYFSSTCFCAIRQPLLMKNLLKLLISSNNYKAHELL